MFESKDERSAGYTYLNVFLEWLDRAKASSKRFEARAVELIDVESIYPKDLLFFILAYYHKLCIFRYMYRKLNDNNDIYHALGEKRYDQR